MEEVTLKGLTLKGEDALRALKEKVDVPLKDRFVYRRMYEERVLRDSPFTLRITPTRVLAAVASRVRVQDFINELDHKLQDLGVVRGIDYTIEGR
jgi:hypothetical protein